MIGEALHGLFEAAARIRDAGPTDALVASTGLSREGVALALERCLESGATNEELLALEARATVAPAVAVLLASNVFVGALRAIAFARVCAPRVIVRPSRRDPEMARRLVEEARDPAIVLDRSFDVASFVEGEVHVYGRDETIAKVKAAARPGVVVRGHGSGMGLAWVDGESDVVVAARAIAADVVVLDQRGCLSPRIVLVEGIGDRRRAFAEALDDALKVLGEQVPRGAMTTDERAASRRYIDTMTMAGDVRVGVAHVVAEAQRGAPLVLPPAHRHVHVANVVNVAEAETLVAPVRSAITVLGSDDPRVRALAPRARLAKLGTMQTPPFDGPVDLR